MFQGAGDTHTGGHPFNRFIRHVVDREAAIDKVFDDDAEHVGAPAPVGVGDLFDEIAFFWGQVQADDHVHWFFHCEVSVVITART